MLFIVFQRLARFADSHRWVCDRRTGLAAFIAMTVCSLICPTLAFAEIKSTSSTINFDSNFDGVNEAVLNPTGLGIGTNTPSANLHVAGNSIVSGTMAVGATSNASGSNLHIQGSYGLSAQTVTGNTTLSGYSVVLVDTSAGNIWMYLPSASSATGRTYWVKKISNSYALNLNGGTTLIDGAGQLTLSSASTGGYPYIKVISSGNAWYILDSSTGGNSIWTPANLSTQSWYDGAEASTVTVSAGAVSQWADKSGNGWHLSASGTAQPTYGTETINGHNALVFDGVNDTLSTSTNPFGTTISNAAIFMVVNLKTLADSTLFSLSGDSLDVRRWQGHVPWGMTVYFDAGHAQVPNRVTWASDFTANQVILIEFYCSAVDNVQEVWINGTLKTSDATGHSVTPIGAKMWLGSGPAEVYDNCAIGECIIINGTVPSTSREKIEGYLAHKWGLSANPPGAHPYKSVAPYL